MRKQSKLTMICSIVSAVLLALLMLTQFLPFWYSVDGVHMTAAEYASFDAASNPEAEVKTVSIARAAWFPEKEKDAPVLLFHALILLFGIVGIFFCATKSYGNLNFVWPMAAAIVAIRGYLVNPPAMQGMFWFLHLIPAALMLIPAIIMLVKFVIGVLRALIVKE